MTKPIQINSSYSLRRNRLMRLRKNIRKIPKGIIYVQASSSNTIVTITDVRGRVVAWSSVGAFPYKFKGRRRGMPFAAQTTIEYAIKPLMDQGMQRACILIKGIRHGRDAALRAICRSGVLTPHNLTRVIGTTSVPIVKL